MIGFLGKVAGLSVVLAIAIKYGGPLLPIAGTTTTVLIAVLLPTGVMAMLLTWRAIETGKVREQTGSNQKPGFGG